MRNAKRGTRNAKRFLRGQAARDEVQEKLFDLFARIGVLMLKPVSGDMLGQTHQCLPEQFRIGASDFF